MIAPQRALLEAARDAMATAGLGLLSDGWDVKLQIDAHPTKDTYVVSLQCEIPHLPIPLGGLDVK